MDIGFIGVGNMGAPMARNLIKAGHSVSVHDVAPGAVAALVADGARPAESASAAAQGVEAVITMLPAGAQVRAVYTGEGGIVAAVAEGTLLIDCSTIDVDSARATADTAREQGLAMLDAPVSGGGGGGGGGPRAVHVGGGAAAVGKAPPLL